MSAILELIPNEGSEMSGFNLVPKQETVTTDKIAELTSSLCKELSLLCATEDLVSALNHIRLKLHEVSPFKKEPVDCVLWVENTQVHANDYNPNSVAPPEMKLLEHSIQEDGYTQPIVGWKNEGENRIEVVDGFHRNRVGKESATVRKRVLGYLPVVVANSDRTDRNDRIASTIRHNRARGKHKVEAMSDIVIELKRRNWSDDKIGKELGMDPDEVLRLCQITGIAEMFADSNFSEAWDLDLAEETDIVLDDNTTDDSGE